MMVTQQKVYFLIYLRAFDYVFLFKTSLQIKAIWYFHVISEINWQAFCNTGGK